MLHSGVEQHDGIAGPISRFEFLLLLILQSDRSFCLGEESASRAARKTGRCVPVSVFWGRWARRRGPTIRTPLTPGGVSLRGAVPISGLAAQQSVGPKSDPAKMMG